MLSLNEISDRLEINDVLIAYCDAIDNGSIDELDNIFVPDALIDFSNFGGPKGDVKLIKAFLKENLLSLPKLHMITNVSIKLAGDQATSRCVCLNPQGFPAKDQPYEIAFFGLWYDDVLVRTDQGWRIKQRTSIPNFTHNLPKT